jgi:hypothetical protein
VERLPGAFLARAFVERMPVHIHTAILDIVVIAGRRGDDIERGAAAADLASPSTTSRYKPRVLC